MKQLEHCLIAGLGARRQSLVEALAANAGIPGELRHATSAREVSNRSKEYVRVGVFQGGGKVLGDGLFSIEIISGVEGGKFDYGSVLVQSTRHPARSGWKPLLLWHRQALLI